MTFFEETCMWRVKPYPGIVALLTRLKHLGLKLAVLSNKPDPQTQIVIAKGLGTHFFDQILGQVDNLPRKPDPSCALMLADKMDARPEDTFFIGDSETDMETGVRAGMKTIAVSWGFRDPALLVEHGAWKLAHSAEEIYSIIESAL